MALQWVSVKLLCADSHTSLPHQGKSVGLGLHPVRESQALPFQELQSYGFTGLASYSSRSAREVENARERRTLRLWRVTKEAAECFPESQTEPNALYFLSSFKHRDPLVQPTYSCRVSLSWCSIHSPQSLEYLRFVYTTSLSNLL